jgi:hypothetical protein
VSHKCSIIGKKIKKAKQKLLFTELAQYVHHYSQYTNLAVLPSQETRLMISGVMALHASIIR